MARYAASLPIPMAGARDGVPPATLDHDGVEPEDVVEGELNTPLIHLCDLLHGRYQRVDELVATCAACGIRGWAFVERGRVVVDGVHGVGWWGLGRRRPERWW